MNKDLLERCIHMLKYSDASIYPGYIKLIDDIRAELANPDTIKTDNTQVILNLQKELNDIKTNDLFNIGKAIERACEILPNGYDIQIHLENGYGGVELYFPDHDADMLPDTDYDNFSSKINFAIDLAIENDKIQNS